MQVFIVKGSIKTTKLHTHEKKECKKLTRQKSDDLQIR
jgi:hypothetical protein